MKRVLLLLALLVIFVPLSAQDDAPVISPELDAHLDQLEATVSEVRGLPALDPVTRLFPTREEAATFFIESFDDAFTQDVVLESTLFYRAFDFVGPDFNIEDIYTDLIVSQVAGYYNTETKEMNTLLLSGDELGDSLPLLERVIYAHEYTHALQDQYFSLDAMVDDEVLEADQSLAALALVEGDATFAMQRYLEVVVTEEPLLALSLFGNDALDDAEIPEGTPAILEAELTMPYLQGLVFVTVLYNAGGWDAVNAAYANPPQSTEQVLHPQKYIDGELPIAVTVSADAGLTALGEDWSLVTESTLGEFYLRQYLLTQLRNADASRAAAGWGGDRYALYSNAADDGLAWVMVSQWDELIEGTEFISALAEFADMRFAAETLDPMADYLCWQGEDALCMTRSALLEADPDNARAIVAVAPSVEQAMALINAQ